MKLHPITYSKLNARQKETYNFHKVAAKLADYGYSCIRLSDDWQGADFIAQHINGDRYYRVQLKSRLTIAKKYQKKALYICFLQESKCFLYNHDNFIRKLFKILPGVARSSSWVNEGVYTWPRTPQELMPLLIGGTI